MPNVNTLVEVVPQILAQGLLTLRQNCVMPRLVNSDFGSDAAKQGATIDIPVPSPVATNPVTPSYTPPDDAGVTPGTVPLPMDVWQEAPFFLSDKDMMEAMGGVIPMQAAEAVKGLANFVDSYLLGLYKGVYGFVGTAGTTPFGSDVKDATNARKVLNNNLAKPDMRRFVFDADAEANALNLRAFQDASWTGDAQAINEGKIVRKLGFDWFMDQNVPTHAAGSITTGMIAKAATAQALGAKSITCTTAASTGACALKTGDVITFAGHDQTYVVTEDATQAAAATDVTVKIEPGLKKALAGSEAVTVKASHVANLAFHRDAIAFANRPLADSADGLGNIIQSAQDPVSGLSLRLEISRQHKRTRWSYDILFGAALVRPELACRVAG
ncbi:P22 phage major capsid protein family protein [Solidesulfovibrio alcoholivorans]|uniref:P22 phage major capsid protein family protein n=1 Tax=Solidesulfovibrio alcoholivorans TaxID=81406 RepID=UPI00049560B2|nr:P22 phage major capsid protein family protein [Solidesulfovibrio alcoholivorans]